MRFEASDIPELRPLVKAIVSDCIEQLRAEDQCLADQIAFTEQQAAQQLGIATHCLRDCRYRGEIVGSRIGRSICYSKSELLRFLRSQEVRR